nr:unnamed protein product [Callosobruchus chinensis]
MKSKAWLNERSSIVLSRHRSIADLDVQRIVRLSSPRTLQDALVKALEIEAATKATRMTSRVRSVEEDDDV